MAKFGEGDERWIVADRPDGQNVNGWHWVEKDVLPWCKTYFNEHLGCLKLVDGEGSIWIKTTGVQSLTGDAIINNRKGKAIPNYELEAKIDWSGEVKDGEGSVVGSCTGSIHFPYISVENHDEDPELRVSTSTEGSVEQRLKSALLANGKKVLLSAVADFVKVLMAGGPVSSSAQASQAAGVKKPKVLDQEPVAKPKPTISAAQKKKEEDNRRSTVELEERFYARAIDLYACFTDVGRAQAFTRSPAIIEPVVGGRIQLFGNNVTGAFMELVPGKRIVMSWRFPTWEDGIHSKVILDFEEPEAGTTILKLTQTGIPEADSFGNEEVVVSVRQGWVSQIFMAIRSTFGYGA